jgi:hypothetical protein
LSSKTPAEVDAHMAKLSRDPRFRIVKDGTGFVLGSPGGAPKPESDEDASRRTGARNSG